MKLRYPDCITVYAEQGQADFAGAPQVQWQDIRLMLTMGEDALRVQLCAEHSPVRYVWLYWRFSDGEKRTGIRVYGDEWERSYGAMAWRGIVPQRCMPWVCAVSNGSDAEADTHGRYTECFGVKTRPGALCFWQYDGAGLTLWLDVRNGGSGVLLEGRTLEVCQIVFATYRDTTAFRALHSFYAALCPDILTPDHKVYGSNNWYYAYGKNSHEEILGDSKIVAELCSGNANRPYMVIDDGWQPNPCDGPWHITNERFPDMKRLADEMREIGVRPGIWIRYLADEKRETPGILPENRLMRRDDFLDPSHPAVLAKVRQDTRRIVNEWGYEFIKHDFTTYDIFGEWGFRRPDKLTEDGWHFYDRTKTSAEIVVNLYRAIYEATEGKAVIIGCNVIGHLTAGLAHLNRTGDDTSGKQWERTRKMGVNTLAFRMLHDKTLYAADADCVGVTEAIDWQLNREWLRALSCSGSPLFVSCKPGVLPLDALAELRDAFARNAVQTDVLEPIDWMENICPERWRLNGKEVSFNWYPQNGIASFVP